MKRSAHRHPKVLRLADVLGCERPTVIGYLELLWGFAAESAPQGDIGRYEDKVIEAAVDWSGRGKPAGRFIQSLIDAGWIDSDVAVCEVLANKERRPVATRVRLLIHDWAQHADSAVVKKLVRAGQGFLIVDGKMEGCRPDASRTPSRRRLDVPAKSQPKSQRKEATNGTLFDPETPVDPAGPVRPDVPAKAPKARSEKRTTEEIRRALGEQRCFWFDELWKIFSSICPHGKRDGMDAFERRVNTKEVATKVYKGALAYVRYIQHKRQSEPEAPAKYLQGWINAERFEDDVPEAPEQNVIPFTSKQEKTMRAIRMFSEPGRQAQ